MNQMKKKGFTLIELLAVIVILAVIALITVPMIRNVIEDTRKGAFKDSVMSAFYEVEYYLLENNLSEIQEGGIEVTSLKLDNNEFEYGIIIQNEEGELEAINVSDGKYCASGSMTALEVHKGECDAEAPKVEVSVEGKVATINLSDNIGVIAYAVTKKDEEVTDWIEIEETTEITETYEATEAGDYTAWVKDKYGKVSSQDFTINQNAFCAYAINYTWDFTYKGQVDTWTVPCNGTYQLEVWGGKGSTVNSSSGGYVGQGGNGGYSKGYKTLSANEQLFIVCGGGGVTDSASTYNGGAGSYTVGNDYRSGAGGGATHIATTNRGVLSNYNSYRNEVLIVAGGGGGGTTHYAAGQAAGGTGGGTTGGNGAQANHRSDSNGTIPNGGTQTGAGTNGVKATFGQGGASTGWNGGGGGGWFGGNGASYGPSGAGGSGYIGGVPTIVVNGTTYTPSTQNGANAGSGKAKITLISIDS